MSTKTQAQQASTSGSYQSFWCNACEHVPFPEKRLLHEHMDQDHSDMAELLKGFEEEFRNLAVEENNHQRQLQQQHMIAQSSSSQPRSRSSSQVLTASPMTTTTQDDTPNYFFCPATVCPQQSRAININVISRHIDKYHAEEITALHTLVSNQKPLKCPGCERRFHSRDGRKSHIFKEHNGDKAKVELLLEQHFRRLPSP